MQRAAIGLDGLKLGNIGTEGPVADILRAFVSSLSGLKRAAKITGPPNFDCALRALELMAVRVDEVLEERHAIAGHESLLIIREIGTDRLIAEDQTTVLDMEQILSGEFLPATLAAFVAIHPYWDALIQQGQVRAEQSPLLASNASYPSTWSNWSLSAVVTTTWNSNAGVLKPMQAFAAPSWGELGVLYGACDLHIGLTVGPATLISINRRSASP
ncbi:hypothetical protein [Mesorhizobium jarvisii]|uniref:hypothetical protein n=1 Tax=Mesorhizobium jarvisii TaxID=1777867 RepID=UPI001F0B2EB5|nr:hypothetical protein [Mesorhizobium jarvisii]MCH4559140.1 hypothetical protein [Mesorhizobium jarvisii]